MQQMFMTCAQEYAQQFFQLTDYSKGMSDKWKKYVLGDSCEDLRVVDTEV